MEAAFVRGIAYYSRLYTRITSVGPSDDFEKWLEHEYEAPAASALERAVGDERLSPPDWQHLVRFAAAQDLRTPARLLERRLHYCREVEAPHAFQSGDEAKRTVTKNTRTLAR